MLIYELGDVVDLVVNDTVKVLLGVVLSNILVGELLEGRHLDLWLCVWFVARRCVDGNFSARAGEGDNTPVLLARYLTHARHGRGGIKRLKGERNRKPPNERIYIP